MAPWKQQRARRSRPLPLPGDGLRRATSSSSAARPALAERRPGPHRRPRTSAGAGSGPTARSPGSPTRRPAPGRVSAETRLLVERAIEAWRLERRRLRSHACSAPSCAAGYTRSFDLGPITTRGHERPGHRLHRHRRRRRRGVPAGRHGVRSRRHRQGPGRRPGRRRAARRRCRRRLREPRRRPARRRRRRPTGEAWTVAVEHPWRRRAARPARLERRRGGHVDHADAAPGPSTASAVHHLIDPGHRRAVGHRPHPGHRRHRRGVDGRGPRQGGAAARPATAPSTCSTPTPTPSSSTTPAGSSPRPASAPSSATAAATAPASVAPAAVAVDDRPAVVVHGPRRRHRGLGADGPQRAVGPGAVDQGARTAGPGRTGSSTSTASSAASALVFTGVHVVAIVADSYVHFGLTEVLVPFTGTWHPVAVAWGIIGFYFLAAVEVTSLLRRRLSKRVWRATHFLSFPLFALTTVHALSAGTDRATFAAARGASSPRPWPSPSSPSSASSRCERPPRRRRACRPPIPAGALTRRSRPDGGSHEHRPPRPRPRPPLGPAPAPGVPRLGAAGPTPPAGPGGRRRPPPSPAC